MSDSRDKIVKLIIEGLMTDGAHHKQWYLEEAFRALCEDKYVNEAKDEFQWKQGTPP